MDFIQAPYEADAQLAYLQNVGIIDTVFSTDSDFLVLKVKQVCFFEPYNNKRCPTVTAFCRA